MQSFEVKNNVDEGIHGQTNVELKNMSRGCKGKFVEENEEKKIPEKHCQIRCEKSVRGHKETRFPCVPYYVYFVLTKLQRGEMNTNNKKKEK